MSTPRVIISGASIAGLSAAFWLSKVGWDVTVIERAESFRDGGQNVDIRGVAHDVLDRMGLVDAIKARNTTETGTIIVDADGRTIATLPSDDPDGATAELEVLRGDFAKVLLDALPDDIQFLYGHSIDTVDDFTDGPVRVGTSAGELLAADLLVIAEGVRSFTRDLVFGRDTDVDARDFGVTMVFGTIPRVPTDDDTWRWYNAVRGRQVHLRPDPYGTTRAILAFAGDDKLIGRDRDDVRRASAPATPTPAGRRRVSSTGLRTPLTCTWTS
jgi:2-polyprenyl-6-methoxyphenol hydroxylase-like FAD-dependent oxidoreductase